MSGDFEPILIGRGSLYIHLPCRNTEWWDGERYGHPINDEGCDVCESAPDGGWRQVYVRSEPTP